MKISRCIPVTLVGFSMLVAEVSAQPMLEAISSQLTENCPSTAAKLAGAAAASLAAKYRPISVDDICSCTTAKVISDVRLQQLLAADDAVVQQRLADEDNQAFLLIKVMAAMQSCFATEIELTIDQIPIAE